MDDRRFDSLVKAFAQGASRRSVLKGILGLGGAALGGGVLLEPGADAARRRTRTPTPITCPGRQTWNGSACVCPSGLSKCGPDCCASNIPSPQPGHSECCDNACCEGTCYGEELCCPTNNQGSAPPSHKMCDGQYGKQCCAYDDECCRIDGCCSTMCHGGSSGADRCCSEAQYCPGGGGSADLCCGAGQSCCGRGTDANVCVDLANDECCSTADCTKGGTVCRNCHNYVCETTVCSQGSICCPTVDGPNTCHPGTCCDDSDCPGCQSCTGGQCVDNDLGCGGCLECVRGACVANDKKCDAGKVCSSDTGQCVVPPCSPTACGSNWCGITAGGCDCGDCPDGFFCTPEGRCCEGVGLGTDENCAFCGNNCAQWGLVCDSGHCAPPSTCTDSSECPGCLDCDGGTCVPNDENCGQPDQCYSSYCAVGGGCVTGLDCRNGGADACCSAGEVCGQETGRCFTEQECISNSDCTGCLECSNGKCVPNSANCTADPCTRSAGCGEDGYCSFWDDCRNGGTELCCEAGLVCIQATGSCAEA